MMHVKITIPVEGINAEWLLEIPEGHEFIQWANKAQEDCAAIGWDAVAVFESALRDCIMDELTLNVVPAPETHPPQGEKGGN